MTQHSSIDSPRRGKISLISIPLCPHLLNLNGEASRLPVLRSVLRLPDGIGLPLYFVSCGLGSKVSTCEGPPFRNRKITCWARARKCGGLGASGFEAAAGSMPALRTLARPSIPKPEPMVTKASRRVIQYPETGQVYSTLSLHYSTKLNSFELSSVCAYSFQASPPALTNSRPSLRSAVVGLRLNTSRYASSMRFASSFDFSRPASSLACC